MKTKTYKRSECEVYCHAERGEASVEVRHKPTDTTVAQWADEDLASMVEDGFFEGGAFWGYDGPRVGKAEFVGSVLDYCESVGLIG